MSILDEYFRPGSSVTLNQALDSLGLTTAPDSGLYKKAIVRDGLVLFVGDAHEVSAWLRQPGMKRATSVEVRAMSVEEILEAIASGRIEKESPAGWLAEMKLAEKWVDWPEDTQAAIVGDCPF